MPLIECTAGFVETPVGGTVYTFNRDRAGRHVADVYDLSHAMCLLSVVWYREVQPLTNDVAETVKEETPATKPAKVVKPKTVKTETPSGFGLLGTAALAPPPVVPTVSETDGAGNEGSTSDIGDEDAGETDGSGEGTSSDEDADTDGNGEENDVSGSGEGDGSESSEGINDGTGTGEGEQTSETAPPPIVLPVSTPVKQQVRRRGKRR